MTSPALLNPPPSAPPAADLTVADAVWVATALLHKETGTDGPFSTEQIVASVVNHRLTAGAEKSIWQHVNQHCVANRRAQPNRACLLTAKGQGNRRLFRSGDQVHPERQGGRAHPDWEKLPPQYAELKTWYEQVWEPERAKTDPLLAAIGIGRGLWADQTADDYVRELRDWGAA